MRLKHPNSFWAWTICTILLHFAISFVAINYDVFYWSSGRHSIDGDVMIYFRYATKALNGEIPYRDYVVEYPIAAFPLFVIPRLFAGAFEGYRTVFMVQMLLFDAAMIVLIALRSSLDHGSSSVPHRLGWFTLYFAILCPLVTGRFDLAPTAIAFAACCSWSSGRRKLGAILSGLGTVMKVFPGIAIAPSLVSEVYETKNRRVPGVFAFALTLIAGMLLWLIIGRSGVEGTFYVVGKRGLELESIYAGVAMLLAKIFDFNILIIDNFGAAHLYFPYYEGLLALIPGIQLGTALAITWQCRTSRGSDQLRYALAALVGFVITGKVLSPQYLIWLTPFVAVLGGRVGASARPLFFMSCFLTRLIYPGPGFGALEHDRLWAIMLLTVRNLTLLVLFVMLVGTSKRTDN